MRAQGESDWIPTQPSPVFALIHTGTGNRLAINLSAKNGERLADRSDSSVTSSTRNVTRANIKPYQTLDEVRRAIHDNFVHPDISDEELTYGAIRGMLSSLGDRFTRFMTPDEYTDFKEKNEGDFIGIGARIDLKDNYIGSPQARPLNASRPYVVEAIDGSPAQRSGVQAGDVILQVDGHSTANQSADAVVTEIKGVRGTIVSLKIERKIKTAEMNRDSVYKVFDLALKRDMIIDHPVKLEWLPNNIAWLRLSEFNERSDDEMSAALAQVQRGPNGMPARGLIFDMRDNPGGLLNSAISIGSRFIPDGPIVSTRERTGQLIAMNAQRKLFLGLKTPMVVMVNNYSASAAEIVTGAFARSPRRDSCRRTKLWQSQRAGFGRNEKRRRTRHHNSEIPDAAGTRHQRQRHYARCRSESQRRRFEHGTRRSIGARPRHYPSENRWQRNNRCRCAHHSACARNRISDCDRISARKCVVNASNCCASKCCTSKCCTSKMLHEQLLHEHCCIRVLDSFSVGVFVMTLSRILQRFRSRAQPLGGWQALHFLSKRVLCRVLKLRRPYRLRTKTARYPLWCRPRSSDLDVFKQIFVMREYALLVDLMKSSRVGLVLDCGANVGYSAAYFLTQFPACELIAVEPDAANFGALQRNLSPYGKRARAVHSGIWSHAVGLKIADHLFRDGRDWSRTVRECRGEETPRLHGHRYRYAAARFGTRANFPAQNGHRRRRNHCVLVWL